MNCTGPIVISNDAQLQTHQQCTTISGNVTFESYVVGDSRTDAAALTLPQRLTTIDGSLEFSNIAAGKGVPVKIEAPQLTTIAGELIFKDIERLQWTPLSSLTSASSLIFTNVNFANLELSGFSVQNVFPQSSPGDFALTLDNTSINAITGSLNGPSSPILTIVNNGQLTNVDISGVSNANITLANNGQHLKATFADLSSSSSLNIDNTADFDAAQLSTVGQATFSNNGFTELVLASLNNISQAFNLSSNPALTKLNVTNLTQAGSLAITNNTMLRNINLPNLTSADDVLISGPVNNLVVTKLTSATVTVSVVPPGLYACDDPPNLNSAMFSCATVSSSSAIGSSTAFPTPTSTSSPSPGNSSSGLSTGAKIGIGVGVGVGGLIILLGALMLWLHSRRRRHKREPKSPTGASDFSDKDRSPALGPGKVPAAAASQPHNRNDRQSAASLLRSGSRGVSPVRAHNDDAAGAAASGAAGFQSDRYDRQEMDARSLPDIEGNDADDDVDRRSLEDIERNHSTSLA